MSKNEISVRSTTDSQLQGLNLSSDFWLCSVSHVLPWVSFGFSGFLQRPKNILGRLVTLVVNYYGAMQRTGIPAKVYSHLTP